MKDRKCPDCGAQKFYVKDPDDQYELFEFDLKDGEIVSTGNDKEAIHIDVTEETETYCDKCAWHDKFKHLKK